MHYAQCKTPLHNFERGCLFRGEINADFLFMDNNARPHRNAEVSNTLESEDNNCMQWFAFPLDLNYVEHVCITLCKCVSQIIFPPRTLQELKTALREDWGNIPPQGLSDKANTY